MQDKGFARIGRGKGKEEKVVRPLMRRAGEEGCAAWAGEIGGERAVGGEKGMTVSLDSLENQQHGLGAS